MQTPSSDTIRLQGFATEDGMCASRSGTVTALRAGVASLQLVAGDSAVLDEIEFEVADAVDLRPLSEVGASIPLDGEWPIAVNLVDALDRRLLASSGFEWRFDPPIVETVAEDSNSNAPLVKGIALGSATASVLRDVLSG